MREPLCMLYRLTPAVLRNSWMCLCSPHVKTSFEIMLRAYQVTRRKMSTTGWFSDACKTGIQYDFYKKHNCFWFRQGRYIPCQSPACFQCAAAKVFSHPNELISAEDSEKILEDKQEKRRKNIGLLPVVLRNRLLDITFVLCLTPEEALKSQRKGCGGQSRKRGVSERGGRQSRAGSHILCNIKA